MTSLFYSYFSNRIVLIIVITILSSFKVNSQFENTDGPATQYLIENNYFDLIPQNLPQQETVIDSGWYPLNSGTFEHLRSVFFINNSIGFATGDNVVLKTTNSGINWSIYIDT
ncbi:MAG: hypothetical protein ACRDFC_10080, partial [Ignavibacteria bacterium]